VLLFGGGEAAAAAAVVVVVVGWWWWLGPPFFDPSRSASSSRTILFTFCFRGDLGLALDFECELDDFAFVCPSFVCPF
jgi:hypothetical protein